MKAIDNDYKYKEDLGLCPKCGILGCTCDPETCSCTPPVEDSTTQSKISKLIVDFE